MSKGRLLINIFLLLVLFGGLFFLTIFAQPIREIINKPQELVAGASDTSLQNAAKDAFPKELANDAKQQIKEVRENALNVKVGELLSFIAKGGKIIDDAKNLQKNVTETLGGTK